MGSGKVKNHDASEVAGTAENADAVQAAFDKAEQLWPVPDRSIMGPDRSNMQYE